MGTCVNMVRSEVAKQGVYGREFLETDRTTPRTSRKAIMCNRFHLRFPVPLRAIYAMRLGAIWEDAGVGGQVSQEVLPIFG